MSSSNNPRPSCYFSIVPSHPSYNDETPSTTPYTPPGANIVSDPTNPLLAYRPFLQSPSRASPITNMNTASFMQLQTQAAHIPSPKRPQPRPLQNVLAVGDDDESNMSPLSSCSSSLSSSSLGTARCSRCRRSQSIDMTTGKTSTMVSYGLNLFYCTRCANIVGLNNR